MSPQPPSVNLNFDDVAGATRSDPQNVLLHWPVLLEAMQEWGVGSRMSQIGMAATVAVETDRKFRPIREYGNREYLAKYDTGDLAKKLGNTPEADGDGILYCGRGYIQITGRANYREVGEVLKLDLLSNPDLLLDPEVCAKATAWWWYRHKVHVQCERRDWKQVRKIVNGGSNKLAEFLTAVRKLGG